MPLVWAHAEYVKLVRSLRDRRIFDLPPQTVKRYLVERVGSPYFPWRFTQKARSFPQGKVLRVETMAPARVHWSSDAWRTIHDDNTIDTGLGLYVADLATGPLSAGTDVVFTLFWPQGQRWEGVDFTVRVI
jgi:glucoamylase